MQMTFRVGSSELWTLYKTLVYIWRPSRYLWLEALLLITMKRLITESSRGKYRRRTQAILFLSSLPSSSFIEAWTGASSTTSTTTPANNISPSNERPPSIRFRARVAYNGRSFQGFQLQNINDYTVQGELERVLNHRLVGNTTCKKERKQQTQQSSQPRERIIRVVGCSRTDAGVHCRGQAVHFDVPVRLAGPLQQDRDNVCFQLNKMLPPSVCIWNIQPAPLSVTKEVPTTDGTSTEVKTYPWNAMYDCNKKLYSYRLSLASVMDPIDRYNRWQPFKAHFIQPDRLRSLLKHYEGTYDFRAFATSIEHLEKVLNTESFNTVRTVYSATLVEEDIRWGKYRIDFELKGALYKQVRIMVSTVLDVCTGRISEKDFLQLLDGNDRKREDNRAVPAPPEGLTLEYVYFDDPNF